jgi:hypothetical protein
MRAIGSPEVSGSRDESAEFEVTEHLLYHG